MEGTELRSHHRDNPLWDAAARFLAAGYAAHLQFTVWCDFRIDQSLHVSHSYTNVHRGIDSDGLELGDVSGHDNGPDDPASGEIHLHEGDGQEVSVHSPYDDRQLGGVSLSDEVGSTNHGLLR